MLKQLKHVDILDTTLRDGSYTIGYQFTADETALIAQGLEFAGVNYIEVGHGLGLGADRAGKGSQAVPDIIYMRACASSIQNAKFGFFFIPGIGEIGDLKLLANEGGKFIRIGVTLESADNALEIIKTAKKFGLEVWVNIMKTYAYQVKECKKWALQFIRAGADGIYIVDSAGGMLPEEVAAYASEIKETLNTSNSNARLGFHGHDNLSLSTASSLSAIQAGCDIVDGSLLGIGRSIGNAATEVLAMVLKRAGYETGVNPWYAADLAEKMIRPFLEPRWRYSSLDQALGFSQIHSGFLPILKHVSEKKNVKIRDIILGLGVSARHNITEADALAVAENIKKDSSEKCLSRSIDYEYHQSNSVNSNFLNIKQPDLKKYVTDIRSQSIRMNRFSAVVITGSWQDDKNNKIKLQQIRLLDCAVVGAIELSSSADLEDIIAKIDGDVDFLFLDKTPRETQWNIVINKLMSRKFESHLLPYADEIAGLISACHIIAIKSHNLNFKEIAVVGSDARAEMFRRLILYWGLNIVDVKNASIIVIASKLKNFNPLFHSGLILIYDLMSGTITSEIAKELFDKGIDVIRLDGRGAVMNEVIGLFEAQDLVNKVSGRSKINNIPVVAGGSWGNLGDVVVDSIIKPIQVIGVADGKGAIKSELNEGDTHKLELVKMAIREKIIGSKPS